MKKDSKEFEEKCMDIIEMVVGIDSRLKRDGAIKVSEKMLARAKERGENQTVIDIYERVLEEFKIASDEEYNLLSKQIHGGSDDSKK